MPFTETSGARIHWDETGSGSPVLLVMGATYSSAMWYPAISGLATSHRVIWFDNRGTGSSEATKVASISDMVADALAVLDAAGVDQAHVYGVSLGGVIVLQLGLESPGRCRSLVLGCTGILDDAKPRAPKWLDVRFRLPKPLLRSLGKKLSYGPDTPADLIARDQEVLDKEQPQRRGLVAQQDALRAYSVSLDDVRGIKLPCLVLHGTADKVVRYAWGEELAQTLPGARFVSLEGAGHNYLVGAADEGNREVLAFLAEVDEQVNVS